MHQPYFVLVLAAIFAIRSGTALSTAEWARPRLGFAPGSRPKRRKPDHSSPAGAASIGPSGLNRRTTAPRSSVRSHRIVGAQPAVPRRQHCRPARLERFWRALPGQSGRPRSLGVAGQRLRLMRGAPDRSRRAIQTARTGALSRATVLRPLAAAFFHRVVRGAARLAGGGAERLESLAAHPPPPASQRKDDLALVATLAASSSGHRHAKWVAGLRYPRNERPQPMRARLPCRAAKHLLARPLPSLSFSSVRSSCTVLVVCYQS
jgi:hypothetical protein